LSNFAKKKKTLLRTLFDEEIKIAKPGSLINLSIR
jgi:hypothetical protein